MNPPGHFMLVRPAGLLGADLLKMDSHFLFASMIWGAIGAGFLFYGKRHTSIAALVAGLGLIGISYFASAAWEMHLLAAIILFVAYLLKNRDD